MDKLYEEYKTVSNELITLENKTRDYQEKLSELKAKDLFYIEQTVAEENLYSQLYELGGAKIEIENNIKEYNLLKQAFDTTGIPILKLENSGQEVTSLANDLLSYFDNDFRIAFDTTKLTKDKKKMKEVFDINVLDSDGQCELKNKSGGERVWIETSIQLALGLLLREQGHHLDTGFLDEQDGSLDSINALNYRSMIENAHNKSGVHNTITITHRQDLIDLIPQQILLGEEGIRIMTN